MPLSDWLSGLTRSPCNYSFGVEDVTERHAPDNAVVAALAEVIIEAKSSREFLEDATEALGWTAAGARLRPGRVRVRRGDFGEALTGAWFAERHGLLVPVPKLRYQISADQTQPETDLLALAVTPQPLTVTGLHFTECKLRTTRNTTAAVDAHRQLIAHRKREYAEILAFVLERLYHENRPMYVAMRDHLAERQEQRSADAFEIALIYDSDTWSERVLENLERENGLLEPLRAHSVRVGNLRRIVDDAFAAVSSDLVIEDDPEDLEDAS